ncbi:hypothetical protein ILUMI_02414 [Ignelater luminosus]|uniref:Uncharacterized protein n=1 Tax=Ignelater luminosus TaxID=2038154 RepID=A0A8K0DNT4_IGNLU|nr:hypothetical protein ILUMI_02414 [Ignelater luminosus]
MGKAFLKKAPGTKFTDAPGSLKEQAFGYHARLLQYLRRGIEKSADIHFGLNPKEVGKLAYQYAVSLKKSTPQSWIKHEISEEDWFSLFLQSNPSMSIRTPESTSLAWASKVYEELSPALEALALRQQQDTYSSLEKLRRGEEVWWRKKEKRQ